MASEPGSLHLVSRLCLTVAFVLSEIMNKNLKKTNITNENTKLYNSTSRWWWWCRASCPRMLGWHIRDKLVPFCFTSTETIRPIRMESPARPPRLSHSSWTDPLQSSQWDQICCQNKQKMVPPAQLQNSYCSTQHDFCLPQAVAYLQYCL